MRDRRLRLVLPCLLALAGPAIAQERPTITVNGEAREEVRPDIALVTLEIADDRPTAPEAASENARLAGVVIEGLKASGLDPKDIATTGASLSPVFTERRDPNTFQPAGNIVTGYHARNEIRVRLREIDRAGAIIGATVQNGALYQGLSYDLSDREARLDGLRGKAAANAAHRAALYAEGLGLKVAGLRSLNAAGDRVGAEPMMAPRMFAAAAPAPGMAPLQIEPGTIDLSASVTATFDVAAP
jgi:uncharacterized protein